MTFTESTTPLVANICFDLYRCFVLGQQWPFGLLAILWSVDLLLYHFGIAFQIPFLESLPGLEFILLEGAFVILAVVYSSAIKKYAPSNKVGLCYGLIALSFAVHYITEVRPDWLDWGAIAHGHKDNGMYSHVAWLFADACILVFANMAADKTKKT
jgi:hypothetical protein